MSSDTPPLRLLLPRTEDLPPEGGETQLAALYSPPPGRHLRVNMIQSVDGGAWGDDGRSGSINDAADWRVFRVLRALADVVLVGAGTVRAESYRPLDRPRGLEHLARSPLELAVVTRHGDVPASLLDSGRAPWVITGTTGAHAARAAVGDRAVVVPGTEGGVDLAAAVDALAVRGLGHVLCEGGPHLLGSMLAAGLVDELCITTSPRLVGTGPGRIVAGDGRHAGGPSPESLRDARLAHLLAAPSGTLLARWQLPG